MEIVQQYTVGFRKVMEMFNSKPPSIEPTATGHIIEQIENSCFSKSTRSNYGIYSARLNF